MPEQFSLVTTLFAVIFTAVGAIGAFVVPVWLWSKKKESGLLKQIADLKNNLENQRFDERTIEQKIKTSKSFLVEGKDAAELMVGMMMRKADQNTRISCVLRSFTFPNDTLDEFESAINAGATMSILIPNLPESLEGMEWLTTRVGYENNIDVHDFLQPKTADCERGPGNFRLILNSKEYACCLGILDPDTKDYSGIYIRERTFFDFMESAFLEKFNKYDNL